MADLITPHSFCAIIEKHLASQGVGLENAKRVYGSLAQYQFFHPATPISFLYCLDREEYSGRDFCQVYSVLGIVPADQESRVAIAAACKHYYFQDPFRFALDPQGFLVIQFHCYCAEISEQVFALRIAQIVPISIKAQYQFVQQHGLEPLPASWATAVRPT